MTIFIIVNILINVLILASPAAQQLNRASVTVYFQPTSIVQESRSLIVSGLCFAELLLFQRFLKIFLFTSSLTTICGNAYFGLFSFHIFENGSEIELKQCASSRTIVKLS